MIRLIKNPEKNAWENIIKRPLIEKTDLEGTVLNIMDQVKVNGDDALVKLTAQLDGAKLDQLSVSKAELQNAKVSKNLEQAILLAKNNIEKFHKNQLHIEPEIETSKGVKCWRKNLAIEKVGLYIPGGTAPLFSTILMLGIPAKIAGCKEIILCTPPDKDGNVNPAILFTAHLLDIDKIFKVGGAQAIAAMTFGTGSIPKTDKIFGPGNQYVTKAKELAQQNGTAIDMPAGPSEVLVITDESANPEFVAADLLSQAEHGPDSQVVLLSNSLSFIEKVNTALEIQVENLPKKETAKKALKNSFAVLLNTLEDCMEMSNFYAPEHLIINTKKNDLLVEKIRNAGSVFIGAYSCESAGDYASGTNHTLPTNGFARSYSGVSTESFMKKISFQEISAEGLKNIGKAIETMAEAEQLMAHKNAVSIRLKKLRS